MLKHGENVKYALCGKWKDVLKIIELTAALFKIAKKKKKGELNSLLFPVKLTAFED